MSDPMQPQSSVVQVSASTMNFFQPVRNKYDVEERDVEVPTADGTCDAALFTPLKEGTFPAVLVWTDVLGLRPVFRAMGERVASLGFVVLVPNPFYRWERAPLVAGAVNLDNLEVRAKVLNLAKLFTNDAIDRDSKGFLAFLSAIPKTDATKKAGVHGYCMGGQFAFRSAAAVPERIGAVGSFHGSMLVTSDPFSPHRLIARTAASYLVAIAQDDDVKQPEAKQILKEASANAGCPAIVQTFAANHGWCVEGSSAFDRSAADEAWRRLILMYEHALIQPQKHLHVARDTTPG